MKTRPLPPRALLLALIIGLSACASPAPPTQTPASITVQLSWFHQAQFAGFYAAEQNGDYAAEGLAVHFVEGGPNLRALDSVVADQAQFDVAGADQLLLWRADGKPVRAIATVYRRSPRVYIALTESGITRPQDFVGRTIAVGAGGQPLLDAMMKRLGISPNQYTVVQSTPDLTPLYNGEVQVRSVFLNNEVLTARAAGYCINVIYPDDYGVHFYADTLFATDELIASNPDVVLRFLRATLNGWTWAVENPERMGALVVKYKPDADAALENEKMAASLQLVNTGEDHIGWMRPEIWAGMEQTLREQAVLTATLEVSGVYTLEFLQQIYGP